MDKCVRDVCGDIIGVLVGATNVHTLLSADNNVLLAEKKDDLHHILRNVNDI